MRPSMSGETAPAMSSFDAPLDVRTAFCSPLFHPTSGTRTSGIHKAPDVVRLAFRFLFDAEYASDARRMHIRPLFILYGVRRVVRRCFIAEKNAYVSHSSGNFSVRLVVRQKNDVRRSFRSVSNDDRSLGVWGILQDSA